MIKNVLLLFILLSASVSAFAEDNGANTIRIRVPIPDTSESKYIDALVAYQSRELDRFFGEDDEIIIEMMNLAKINDGETVFLSLPKSLARYRPDLIEKLTKHWAQWGIKIRPWIIDDKVTSWIKNGVGLMAEEVPSAIYEAWRAPHVEDIPSRPERTPGKETITIGSIALTVAGVGYALGYIGFPMIPDAVSAYLPEWMNSTFQALHNQFPGMDTVKSMGAWYTGVVWLLHTAFTAGPSLFLELADFGYSNTEEGVDENGNRKYRSINAFSQIMRRVIVSCIMTVTVSALTFKFGEMETALSAMKYMGLNALGWALYGSIRMMKSHGDPVFRMWANVDLLAVMIPLGFVSLHFPSLLPPGGMYAVTAVPAVMAILLNQFPKFFQRMAWWQHRTLSPFIEGVHTRLHRFGRGVKRAFSCVRSLMGKKRRSEVSQEQELLDSIKDDAA